MKMIFSTNNNDSKMPNQRQIITNIYNTNFNVAYFKYNMLDRVKMTDKNCKSCGK